MRSPAVVEDVLIVWIELSRFVQSVSCVFRLVLRQTNHSQPHLRGCVLWVAESVLCVGSVSLFQMVESKLGDSQKQVSSVQMGHKRERFLKACDCFFVMTSLLVD